MTTKTPRAVRFSFWEALGLATALLLLVPHGTAHGIAPPAAIETHSPADSTDAAWEAWHLRQFEQAATMATDILATQPDNASARHLRMLASYLLGDYEASLADYSRLDPTYERYDELARPVMEAYLHLNRFAEAVAHARRTGMPEATVAWLEQRARLPMTVRLDATTILSFLEDDFLNGLMPAIPIELNGESATGHLDTGAPFIVMSEEKADAFGIETTRLGSGTANDQTTEVFVGLADSLRLGEALLTNVPVAVVQTLQGAGKDMVILGANIFQQFLTTWDNEHRRIIFTPRGSKSQRQRHIERFASEASELPFYMAGDHYLWAEGAVGPQAALYFVDTGLVMLDDRGRQASAAASKDLLTGWGYEATENTFVDSNGPMRLGPISRPDGSIRVWADRRNIRPWNDIQPDVLLSFGFLKHYNWTLDFDRHIWYVSPVAQPGADAGLSGPAPEELAGYVGAYEVAPGVHLNVSLGERQLLLQAPGQQKVPMTWVEGTTFEIALAGATVVFEREASGAVIGLLLQQGGVETKARKVE